MSKEDKAVGRTGRGSEPAAHPHPFNPSYARSVSVGWEGHHHTHSSPSFFSVIGWMNQLDS